MASNVPFPKSWRTNRSKCHRCGWTHADDYNGCLKPKPRRRPTDTERLDALLRWMREFDMRLGLAIVNVKGRRDIDKLLKEEAKRVR